VDQRYAPPSADEPALAARGMASDRVFEYFTQPSGARMNAIGCFVVLVPAGVALLFGLVLPSYAVPAAALTAIAMWWRSRRQVSRPQATLCIEESRLRVLDRDSREILNIPLKALLEVELDTKTVQRVQDNLSGGGLPHFRLLHGKVGSATDISRIVLVTSKQDLPLSEERVSISYTTESFGKMRRFLRTHGWLPKGERAKA
jgi:hypothetical protein